MIKAKYAKKAVQKATPPADVQDENVDEATETDELAQPEDILSKLPTDFYECVEDKNWHSRKGKLEAVELITKVPKLENGDYGDLIRALNKVVQKDSNIVCVAAAGRCLANIAKGLRKKFQPYAGLCVPAILEKFKDKKPNVVSALRYAIDAIYLSTRLEAILEDVLEALNNKSPSVKIETLLFLARAFTKTQPAAINKKLLKTITGALIKNINEPDPGIREASAETLGVLMKLIGEKTIRPFLVELEKDNLKMTRIKQFCEKAVITVNVSGATKERSTTAPTKTAASKMPQEPVKPPAKNAAEVKKKPVILSGTATVVKSKGTKGVKSASQNIEKELTDEEVDEVIAGIFDASLVGDLSSEIWKTRLEASETILREVQKLDSMSVPTLAIIKFLSKRPGLKDANFQVLRVKLNIIKYLAENCNFTLTAANCCVADISEKFSDTKNGVAVAETLTAIAEANSLGQISEMILNSAAIQKSPKVQQDALVWLNGAIRKFGFNNINVKLLIEESKKALASTNLGVRQAAISLLGTVYLYMGAALKVFFKDEKPAIREQLSMEFDKYEGEKPPVPTRGLRKPASSYSLRNVDEDESQAQESEHIQDHSPRVDISNQISHSSIKTLKEKREAIVKMNKLYSGHRTKSTPAPTDRKEEKDMDTSLLLSVNNLKEQRTIDETNSTLLKWDFTQPSQEFVERLKNQMTAARVNRTLMANMFHADSNYRIQAIESLSLDLQRNIEGLIANLDLVLKWLILCFSDSDISVVLKGLEYLHSAFDMLIRKRYRMLENEASLFIPRLVQKVSDTEDTVRTSVMSLIYKVYYLNRMSKTSLYIMEHVKSQDDRYRAECLEVLATAVKSFGIVALVETPYDFLKEMSKHISDLDNSVRNAAFKCIAQAYKIWGEKTYRDLGNLSKNDRALLEEIIKILSRERVLPKPN